MQISDHYYFDEQRYRAVGARGGAVINIGQRMGVIVENVDTELNRIDFAFEDEFENTPARKPGAAKYRNDKPSKPGRKGRAGKPGKSRFTNDSRRRASSGRKGKRKK